MADYISLSKDDWIVLMEKFNNQVYEACSGFSEKQWNKRSNYIGWRVRDVLVNITRAKVVNFWQLLERALADKPYAPEEFNTFIRGQREVDLRRDVTTEDLLADFRYEADRLLDLYKNMSEEEWKKPAWFFVGPVTVRDLLLTEFGDNIYHLRDMLLPNNLWKGLDKEYTEPLADWFMRVYRPAHFREDKANGLNVKIMYRLSGVGGGSWTMTIANNKCIVERGIREDYDVVLAAGVEDLVGIALARTYPWIGGIARSIDWIRGKNKSTDVVSGILHYSAFIHAILSKKIRIGRNRKLGIKVNRNCFWHFYQRTAMTQLRIRQSRKEVKEAKP